MKTWSFTPKENEGVGVRLDLVTRYSYVNGVLTCQVYDDAVSQEFTGDAAMSIFTALEAYFKEHSV